MRHESARIKNSGLVSPLDMQQGMAVVQQRVLAELLAQQGLRMDGRGALDVRPMHIEANKLPVGFVCVDVVVGCCMGVAWERVATT